MLQILNYNHCGGAGLTPLVARLLAYRFEAFYDLNHAQNFTGINIHFER